MTTVRRWEKAGKRRACRTQGGHRRFELAERRRVLVGRKRREKRQKGSKTVVYAQVSSHDQKDDLKRQEETLVHYCREHDLVVCATYKAIGSGLNSRRKGLVRVMKKIARGGINKLIITYKDRLTRFGFTYLERFFQHFGTEIVIVSDTDQKEKSMEQELVEDLVAIISSFSGRMHGMRSAQKRKKPTAKNHTVKGQNRTNCST